jgi:hypothetical protein
LPQQFRRLRVYLLAFMRQPFDLPARILDFLFCLLLARNHRGNLTTPLFDDLCEFLNAL